MTPRDCLGMKECTRALARGQLKAAVVAPNLEKSEGAGGLDEEVGGLIEVRRCDFFDRRSRML